MRIAAPDGAVAVTHAHNANQWNPSAGMPLPPDAYRDLFDEMAPRVFAEGVLLSEIVAGGPLDLSARHPAAAIDADPALTIVASRRDDVFRRYPLDRRGRASEFRLNPLYEVRRGDLTRLRLRFPSSDYEGRATPPRGTTRGPVTVDDAGAGGTSRAPVAAPPRRPGAPARRAGPAQALLLKCVIMSHMPQPTTPRRSREQARRISGRRPAAAVCWSRSKGRTAPVRRQRKLFKTVQAEGYEVVSTKWSSSDLIKPLIKSRKAVRALNPEEFSLLHAADFRHRVEHVILPALWAGKLVIADRFLFTALARDVARGLDLDWVLKLYQPLVWPDLVFYFAVSPLTSGKRVTATRLPNYEAGQTDGSGRSVSYQRFIGRVIREYDSLALIFNFITVDAEQSIAEQHRKIRALFREGERRPWCEWNVDAVAEWLSQNGRRR